MTNLEMARIHLRNADRFLEEAEGSLRPGLWHLCVRRGQEAIEAATKGALRMVGVEPPKWHDVGPVLEREAARFPAWFREQLPQLVESSALWRRHRELSYYGDEEQGLTPDQLYKEEQGRAAVEDAHRVLEACSRLVEELSGS